MSAIVTGMCYCICVACVSTVRHSIKRKETITERDLANAALSVAIASIRLSCGMLVVVSIHIDRKKAHQKDRCMLWDRCRQGHCNHCLLDQ